MKVELWFTKVTSPASIFTPSAVSSISGLFTSLTLAKIQKPRGDEPGKKTVAVKGGFITCAEGSRRFSLVVAPAISHLGEIPQGRRVGELFTWDTEVVEKYHSVLQEEER